MATITFAKPTDLFWVTLKGRVDAYFATHQIPKTGDIRLYIKTVVFLASAVVTYTILMFYTPDTGWISALLCGLLGLSFVGMGFNIMHDALHGSYSSKKWANFLLGSVLLCMGASVVLWKKKHNTLHHTETNLDWDDDINFWPWMRVLAKDKLYWFHRFQHIYGPLLLYPLLYITWIYGFDLVKYFRGRIGNSETGKVKFTISQHIGFWVTKVAYTYCFIILPGTTIGWIETAIGYGIMSAMTGFTISIIFQLAHITESATFPVADADQKLSKSFHQHQVEETADFSTDNPIMSWFVGGLNYQVVHHLFPGVSHVHYPDIQPIVKETCKEFNLPYIERPFGKAVASHIRKLKELGTPEKRLAA